MKIFLIIVAVIVVIFAILFSLSATITIVHEKGWSTKIKVLWIEKDIVLSDILSFLLFPEKKAEDVAEADKKKKEQKKKEKEDKKEAKSSSAETKKASESAEKSVSSDEKTEKVEADETDNKEEDKEKAEKKPGALKKIWDEEGIVGILALFTNIAETANSALITLFRGLHIYSIYVMIIVGGGDADTIAQRYGVICKYYYPVKGIILNGMKVDNYDDYVQPDFIAPSTEFQMQFIGSISVGLLVRVLLKAGIAFLKNLLQNKKDNK